MNFKPLKDQILVRRIDPEEKHESGLVIPKKYQKRKNTGKVLAVGPGYRNDDGSYTPLSVKVDDVVMINKSGWKEVEVNGEKLLIMAESVVDAIVEE